VAHDAEMVEIPGGMDGICVAASDVVFFGRAECGGADGWSSGGVELDAGRTLSRGGASVA